MPEISYFDSAERRREKQRQRDLDEFQLQEGLISREELRARNSFLGSLDIVESSIIFQEYFN